MFRYYGGWTTKLSGQVLPVSPPAGQVLAYTRHEPFGVVGIIVPWNFPLLITSWKVAPALAAGNSVVLKPAEQTSLTAVRLAELALQAGMPAGVLNVVTGLGPTAGAALVSHPLISTIAFTGSTEVGRAIMTAAATAVKPVHLELGGKSPNIVFDDADIAGAIQGAAVGIFFNQGQVCCAGSRLYVQDKAYDAVIDGLATAASGIKLGHGLAEGTEMGPLISAEQLTRVSGFVDRSRAQGARSTPAAHHRPPPPSAATSTPPPSSPTPAKPPKSPAKKSLAPSSSPNASPTKTTSSPAPTPAPTAWPPASGPATSPAHTASPPPSKPAPSGSTTTT